MKNKVAFLVVLLVVQMLAINQASAADRRHGPGHMQGGPPGPPPEGASGMPGGPPNAGGAASTGQEGSSGGSTSEGSSSTSGSK